MEGTPDAPKSEPSLNASKLHGMRRMEWLGLCTLMHLVFHLISVLGTVIPLKPQGFYLHPKAVKMLTEAQVVPLTSVDVCTSFAATSPEERSVKGLLWKNNFSSKLWQMRC